MNDISPNTTFRCPFLRVGTPNFSGQPIMSMVRNMPDPFIIDDSQSDRLWVGQCYARTPCKCPSLSHGEPSVSRTCSTLCDKDVNSISPISSFVFDNYTWNPDGPDYTDYNGKLIPSRIPLSAIMSGKINSEYSPDMSYSIVQVL